MESRAYWYYNGQWKHVYILDKFTQKDIFGNDVLFVTVKLTKHTKATFDTEFSRLEGKRPKTHKEYVQ